MSDALQRLIDAMKQGGAYHGSLDAAKAVHDTLLPEWFVAEMTEFPRRREWVVRLAPRNNADPGFRSEPVIHKTQEGAWLIAIHRVYQQVKA